MSEDNQTDDTAEAKKAREPKKNSIAAADIKEMVDGIPQYDKTSFLVVGHKDGVRIALPRTTGVSRAYFYGNGDYSLIPEDEAIIVFSAEDRKENRRGGIMAEVNFELGLEAAKRALGKLVDVVKAAPAPVPKTKPTKREKVNPSGLTDSEVAEADASDADV